MENKKKTFFQTEKWLPIILCHQDELILYLTLYNNNIFLFIIRVMLNNVPMTLVKYIKNKNKK
jgi:hypothetical protein